MRERKRIHHHNGYMLRSHTERVWAELMDVVGVHYLYEPHLLRLPGRKYLPDFYIPEADVYFEVKGPEANGDEKAKAEQAYRLTGRPVFFLQGKPESDRGGFTVGMISFLAQSGWRSVSLFEVGEVFSRASGRRLYQSAVSCVMNCNEPVVQSMGSSIDEILCDFRSRSENEVFLRERHAEVNEVRAAMDRIPSVAERLLKQIIERFYPDQNCKSSESNKECGAKAIAEMRSMLKIK